jgi:transposase InsO family protein
VTTVVQILHELHQRSGCSLRQLIVSVGLARSSVLRWTDRLRRGQPAIRSSGTPKATLEQPTTMEAGIAALHHGAHRSRGAPALWRLWQQYVSRRDFGARVRDCRRQLQRAQRESLWRIVWRQAGAVWAMDPAEYGQVRWNLVGDLASRLRFELLVAAHLPARRIAAHLAELFERYGPPLVLKRDNGSNLVHPAVDELLEDCGVLALTSPPYYPRYNGAIEYAQREIKAAVDVLTVAGTPLSTALAAAPVLLNAQCRPCLGGATAFDAFHEDRQAFQRAFTVDRRKEVKRWIQDRAQTIVDRMPARARHAHDAAWRQAVEDWLLDNRLITVVQPKEVSPLSA